MPRKSVGCDCPVIRFCGVACASFSLRSRAFGCFEFFLLGLFFACSLFLLDCPKMLVVVRLHPVTFRNRKIEFSVGFVYMHF